MFYACCSETSGHAVISSHDLLLLKQRILFAPADGSAGRDDEAEKTSPDVAVETRLAARTFLDQSGSWAQIIPDGGLLGGISVRFVPEPNPRTSLLCLTDASSCSILPFRRRAISRGAFS